VVHRAYRTYPWLMWGGLALATLQWGGSTLLTLGSLLSTPAPSSGWTIEVLVLVALIGLPTVGFVLIALRWPTLGGALAVLVGLLAGVFASVMYVAHTGSTSGMDAGAWLEAALILIACSVTLVGGVLMLIGKHRDATVDGQAPAASRSTREKPVTHR
jgi:hypothetical protein